ncbi:MAG TPA: Uma2 family endonuclease [Pyrinomonadaceae bacterium]|nr:Uma2 family endonuclease [Pyrinomonadaceae bacterium]
MSTTTQLMTAEELFVMPDDDFRYDLVKGELKRMSPAGSEHGAIALRLGAALYQYVEENNLGEVFGSETGFKLASSPDTVRAPDIAFVREERIPESGIPQKFWDGAPDLAVEVVSPGDSFDEVAEKINDYLSAGTRAVWIISPKRRTVSIHRAGAETITLNENDLLDGQEVVPGFQYTVAKLFTRRRTQR